MDADGDSDLVDLGAGDGVSPLSQSGKERIGKSVILRPVQAEPGDHPPLGQVQLLALDIAVEQLLHPNQGFFPPLSDAVGDEAAVLISNQGLDLQQAAGGGGGLSDSAAVAQIIGGPAFA